MILFNGDNLHDITVSYDKIRKKSKTVSNTIYTFDIETTSLFLLDGDWKVFDFRRKKDSYLHDTDTMLGIPYIWQFSIEDTVYYGRDFMDFEKVLLLISDKILTKVVWIHNLSFELQYLQNIFDKYTITDMCARDVRKPISFHVEELNIDFRCSYMLTNLSLEKASEEYTSVKKKDTLDYTSKCRTELTKLTKKELEYCEYDCICLYNVIKYYRDTKYGSIAKIPLTSTSEVRKALLKVVDYWYLKKQWDLVPSADIYIKLMASFQGGYTHANVLNTGRIFDTSEGYNITSYDLSSSYPTVMCLEVFPSTPFRRIDYEDYVEKSKTDKYLYIMRVRLNGVKSRYYNNYISYSKCLDVPKNIREGIRDRKLVYDNGRIQQIDHCELYVTNLDLELIVKNYKLSSIDYLEIYASESRPLDKRVVSFILDMYKKKTTLKGLSEFEDVYKQSKACINSLYGCSVTNPLKNSSFYIDGEWGRKALTDEFVDEVLNDARKSYSTLFFYGVGVFVTSYARYNLYSTILSSHDFDRHVIYCDTDSIKYYGDFDDIFKEYNKRIYEKYKKVCSRFSQLKISDFMPKDKKGVEHPLGYWDFDGSYTRFRTWGAKKYAYEDDKGLHITVSGVSKKGASALKNLEEFKKDFEWGYKDSHKLAHYYNDSQPLVTITDADGNRWTNKYIHGLILQPTTYKLGVTDVYEALIEYYEERDIRQ